jgi:hypothetical protein
MRENRLRNEMKHRGSLFIAKALNERSLREVERRSNPKKNEIAAPFALYTMRCRASGSQ